MELPVLSVLMAAVLGYLFGSIPFGLVSGFFFGLGDIRKIGSGNIGATNVLRTGNKKAALLTLILDGSKGALAVFIVPFLLSLTSKWSGHPDLLSTHNDEILALTVGCFAFLGHVFPVWLQFQGGKGVATFLGLQFALNGWVVGLLSCAYWLMGWKCSSISSVGAITTAILTPMTLCVMNAQGLSSTQAGLVHSAMAILLIFRHHTNIKRLLQGKEPKSGGKSADKAPEPAPVVAEAPPPPAPVVEVVPAPPPMPAVAEIPVPSTPDIAVVAATAVVASAVVSEIIASSSDEETTSSVAPEETSSDTPQPETQNEGTPSETSSEASSSSDSGSSSD